MDIAIVGAGAMGSLFGARLALQGHQVLLIDTWQEHVEAIAERGLQVEMSGDHTVVQVPAATRASGRPPAELVMLLVKANRLEGALATNSELVGQDTCVLTLANGLGTGDVVARIVGPDRTVVGATAAGAILDGPGRVVQTVWGETYLGPYRGEVTPRITRIGELFDEAGLPAKVTSHVEEYIWNKLLINVAYNALGAISRLTNGEVGTSPEGRQLITALVSETVAVAKARGIPIHQEDPVGYCLSLAEGPIGPNPSSMLQDVLRERPTEVDFINGAVARLAASAGIQAPTNALVASLMKLIERSYSPREPKAMGASVSNAA